MRRRILILLSFLAVVSFVLVFGFRTRHLEKTSSVTSNQPENPVVVEPFTEDLESETAAVLSTEEEPLLELGFVFLTGDELRMLTRIDLEIYLSDFYATYLNHMDFEQLESTLLNEVFRFAPEVAVRYLSDYRVNPESRPMVMSAVVADLFRLHPESELKEAFYRYLDTYNQLPAGWFMMQAMRTEVAGFLHQGDPSLIPGEVTEYALKGFLDGEIRNYLTITFLGLRDFITDEQLISVFLQTSPSTLEEGLDELLFDVIALRDARTFDHLLSFMQYHPKKLSIYRSLSEMDEIDISPTIQGLMSRFATLTEDDKLYVSVMALDIGDKAALHYLVTHTGDDFNGPVPVNIKFLLKRRLPKPATDLTFETWVLQNIDKFEFDAITQTFR
ncbi:hypothetical protein [Reinekea sp. G2M2-21]|uniref:hypothetical protein n=1 Tax=Reinekea sp. G2M2-21 TaxID=2788942 RepID=UPI0018ABEE3F|nr:hypothetical protein [Reinekea sp. G2M2-21]